MSATDRREEHESGKHVDCTLCGECIASCPEKSLNINRRPGLRWVPVILVIVLFFLALWMSQHWELPTIDERWGDEAKIERLESFERDGMRTVKCFGSSKAFANKMRTVPGVYGVTTYVNRFAVVIHYDPERNNQRKVEESMSPHETQTEHAPGKRGATEDSHPRGG